MTKEQSKNLIAAVALILSLFVSGAGVVYSYGSLGTRVDQVEHCCEKAATKEFVDERHKVAEKTFDRLFEMVKEIRAGQKVIMRLLPQKEKQ